MLPPAVASYYAALDAGDDDAAAAAFAENAVYIRPALEPAGGNGIEVFRGRAAIRDLFERRSARKQFGDNLHHHEFRSAAVESADCFIEGTGVTDRGPCAPQPFTTCVGKSARRSPAAVPRPGARAP